MNETTKIEFYEANLLEKETISFHIPHAKKLNSEHRYFNKRTVWVLVHYKDTEDYPYEAIEEDKRNGIRYSFILTEIVGEINGLTNEFIKNKINTENCFQFDFTPSELDKLTIRSDYEFNSIKAIPQPYSRVHKYMSFTFKNGIWEIDEKEEKRIIKDGRGGIVKITS